MAVVTVALLSACADRRNSRAQAPPHQPHPHGHYPPGQYPPGQYPPGQPPPAHQAPPPGQPPPVAQPPLPVAGADPINRVDINFLRGRAQSVIRELIAALQPDSRQRVETIPLVVDDTPGEVNAFAACIRGRALMAISDGLLDIEAHLARAKATDELFRTNKTGEYISFIARHQRPRAPVARPPAGFFIPQHDADPRKIRRQHELLDEQLAFVLGHELGHHYLGHLPCTAAGGVGALDPGELGRALSGVLPLFNQPNELAADVAGTNNLLTAGARRQGHRWTEGGALLTMQFFSGMDQMSPTDILFGFERSHPPPLVRVPVIQQTANTWRFTGGVRLPFPGFGG